MPGPERVFLDGLVHNVFYLSRSALSGTTQCFVNFHTRKMHGRDARACGKPTKLPTSCFDCIIYRERWVSKARTIR